MRIAAALSSAFHMEAQMSTQRPISARNEPFCDGVRFTGSPPLLRFPIPAETDGMRIESASGPGVRMLGRGRRGDRPQPVSALQKSEASSGWLFVVGGSDRETAG